MLYCWNTYRWTIPMLLLWISDFATALLSLLSSSFRPLFVLNRLSLLLWTKYSHKHHHISETNETSTHDPSLIYSYAKPTIGVGFRELFNNRVTRVPPTPRSFVIQHEVQNASARRWLVESSSCPRLRCNFNSVIKL